MIEWPLNPTFVQALQENHNVYWHRSNMPQSLLQECPKCITTQRHLMNSNTGNDKDETITYNSNSAVKVCEMI